MMYVAWNHLPSPNCIPLTCASEGPGLRLLTLICSPHYKGRLIRFLMLVCNCGLSGIGSYVLLYDTMLIGLFLFLFLRPRGKYTFSVV